MEKPPPPGRLIVPGAEDEPAPERRIILPPGATLEEPEDLPEYPKLRSLILVPFNDGKRELLLVSDPLGVIRGQPVLSIETLALIQLLDGSASLTDIVAALARESKDLRIGNVIREFVAELDRLLMLESPRFEAAYRETREAYHHLEIRPAALEGRSYPADRRELDAFLDEHFALAELWRDEASEPVAAADHTPRALLAPHLDPRRAGPAIARAYLEIGPSPAEPLRVVIFGTGHSLIDESFALTRKHFETPLGKVRCDTAFVDAVAGRLGERAYRAELAHREEHSIEFQALYLRKRLGDRPFTIVPLLCGGFHALQASGRTPREDEAFESLIESVRAAEREQPMKTIYVAGVDLSHVGTRFGDEGVDERTKTEVESRDRAALDAALGADADAWYRIIAEHEDSTRICGWAPTYAMLRCAAPGPGRLLRYEQSDEPEGSMVSLATAVWD